MKPSNKIKAFKHQLKSLEHAKANPRVFDCSDPGCVSADTEFLTPTGWKRIDQYAPGDFVAQFYPNEREIEFVAPLDYIKKPCAEMIHIAPARGTSQRLSPEHRVLYYQADGQHGVCSAEEFMDHLHTRGPAHANRKFCSTFTVRSNRSLPLTDWQLRLMVAVIADSHFAAQTTRCVIRLKKDRKVERLRMLLAKSATPYKARVCGGDPEFLVFSFHAPRRDKEFTEFYWGASQRQLELIADELPHWDSSVDKRKSKGTRFSTLSELSADFAQYAFAAAKRPASLAYQVRDRTHQGRGISVEYNVHAQASDQFVGPGRKDSVYLAPNPEGFKYCFEVPTSFLLLRHNGYIFATGNTGKTFVSLVDAEYKIKHRQAKKVLVIAPKSLLRSVWYNDAKKFTPGLRVSVSTAGKHEKAFAEDADIYVTNTDAVKWLAKQPKSFFKDFDFLVNDESSAFKHHTSQRSRAMAKIAKNFKYRRLMTGTPNSNGITDVWHQMFLVDDGQRLGKSFFAFRNTVCEPIQKGFNVRHVEWHDRPGAEDAVFGTIMDVVVRHKFEDCVDIPPNHTYSVPYYMPPSQELAYAKMRDEMVIQVYGSLEAVALAKLKGEQPKVVSNITAVHAASMQTKLMQIASGAVYESPDKYHVIDTTRYELTLDMVEQREHSLVMFLWKHQRDAMIAEAERRGVTFAVIDGTVPEKERDAIVKMYQAGRYQTVFAHPKSAGHGLTFTRGTATIWPSPTFDAELFTQGSKRQHRIGQTKKTETITLVADNTVEERVYEVLTGKRQAMNNFLDLLATAV